MVDLGYFFTTILTFYLPIPDGMIKMQMAMALGQMCGQLCEPALKWLSELNIWNRLYMKNHITIGNEHPHYENIINFVYLKFNDQIKGANMCHSHGKKNMLIEVLQISSLKDGDIEISFGELPKDNKDETQLTLGKKIIFSSSKSLTVIEKYVSEIIKECCRKKNNTITTFSLNIEKSEKTRNISWKRKVSTSNKTITNTIVRDSVKENFYDDLTRFMESESIYKSRGISYKRGYLVHGIPGSGKSSMVAAIANEWGFPVFKLDMSVLKNNEELAHAENTIYDYIGPFDPHILLIEDFDRSTVMDLDYYGKSSSNITMDCILNILDGIEQTYGRIVIMTANNVTKIKRTSALIRPGRIDRIVQIDNCDVKQIRNILKLYFDKDAEICDDVQLTPANLNKIIQVMVEFDNIVQFINRFKNFSSGEQIEKLAAEYKVDPDIEDNKVDEIRKDSDSYTNHSRRVTRARPKRAKLPWGVQQLEKYSREIKRLNNGDIKLSEITERRRVPRDSSKIHAKDNIEVVKLKMENVATQTQIKIKTLEEKKKNLVVKMKSRGTWDEYIAIGNKKEHMALYKNVLAELNQP